MAPAVGAYVHVSPAYPTSADTLTVAVAGDFTSRCWEPADIASCSRSMPETLSIVIEVQYCRGLPGCACAQLPFQATRSCRFGPLPPGSYVARCVELHVNPADPIPTSTALVPFTVTGTTQAAHRTWGTLKLLYR